MLLFGQFNYGRRGILDLTHTRLLTFATFRRLLEGASFRLEVEQGVVAPFTTALGDTSLSRLLLAINRLLAKLRPELFAYQIFVVAVAQPPLPRLLGLATEGARERTSSLNIPNQHFLEERRRGFSGHAQQP